MAKLPPQREIYCEAVGEKVTCGLVRRGDSEMRADVYECSRRGRGEDPCDPCSIYEGGRFLPLPEGVFNEDGTIAIDKLQDAVHMTTEVPKSSFLRMLLFFLNR